MNKKAILIIGIIILLILLIIACSLDTDKKEYSNDPETIIENATTESENINDNEKKDFIEININEYINIYNGEEKKIVLVGRPTCQYCQIAEPILQNISYNYDIDIYYLNVDNFEEEDVNKFVETSDNFSNGFGTPMLLVVGNNSINDMLDSLSDTMHYKEFLKENGYIK